ncbi:MAG: enoyl-CoA hydratase-related protein [Bacteroidota bacterium]|nr:enoyl-CoA hydratase-related protein [Bacteroidota bacterium]
MEFSNIKVSIIDGVMVITINRPDKLNALNFDTLKELHQAIKYLYDEKEAIGAIITGEGEKAFVAGADISEIAKLGEMNGRKAAENGQEIFDEIENCPKLIIAAVNGYALGGGCELAMACHIRIASDNAKFGQPEINLGIIPGYGATQRLPLLVGKGKALELIITGDMIDAKEAERIGLVNYVTSSDRLMPMCMEMMKKVSEKPPVAVGLIIESVNAAFHKEENGYQTEANSFAACISTEDFKEGTQAFFEKRKPKFNGN